jgi:hypothetical protein
MVLISPVLALMMASLGSFQRPPRGWRLWSGVVLASHVPRRCSLAAALLSSTPSGRGHGAGVLGRGHAGGGAAVDAVHDHGGVAGVVVTNLLNRLAKYTLLLNFWC